MSENRILRLKPALRLEWRGQHGRARLLASADLVNPVQARVLRALFWRHLSKFMSEFQGVSLRFGRSPTIATFFAEAEIAP